MASAKLKRAANQVEADRCNRPRTHRMQILEAIFLLIELLDKVDGNDDLEPSLGWPDQSTWWKFSSELGARDDREEEVNL